VREVVDLAAVATVYAAAMGQLPPVPGMAVGAKS
jgi:hypothetical protein